MSRLRERLNRHLKGGNTDTTAEDTTRYGQAEFVPAGDGAVAGGSNIRSGEPATNEPQPIPASSVLEAGDSAMAHAGASSATEECWASFDTQLETNGGGSFLLRRRRYPLPYMHGTCELSELLTTGGELLALTAGEPVAAERVLFLDTETTGLGIGAGNVPFMIGIGFYEPDAFVVEQLFIRNAAEEQAMLAYLNERLSRYSHLVTYNGRSFDWPIVKNRFILNRMALEAERIGQLDFLYPARSLWRTVLSACRLSVVEEERLGFVREDDVPGSMAPTLYFRYLAEKDPTGVMPVFTHNEHDILSLAGLAVHLTQALAGQLDYVRMGEEELYRTAVWLEKKGKHALADRLIEELLGRHGDEKAAYYAAIAPLYKRRGDDERAAGLWLEAVHAARESFALQLEPWIELAMYYEHKKRDPHTALDYAEEAGERLKRRLELLRREPSTSVGRRSRRNDGTADAGETGETKAHAQLQELEKRIARLRRKGGRLHHEGAPLQFELPLDG